MRLKIFAVALLLAGFSLVLYGLKSNETLAVQTDKVEPSHKISTPEELRPRHQNSAISTGEIQTAPSVFRNRYVEMRKCLDSEDTELQKLCVGAVISEYDEYRSQILANFQLELESYVQDLNTGSEQRVYEDLLLAREILLNENRSNIQLAALNLLKLFSPEEENLEVLEVTLATCTDEQVLTAGLEVLDQYQNISGFNETFDLIIEEQLRLGTNKEMTQIATRALMQQMNPARYERFKQIYIELQSLQEKAREVSSDSQSTLQLKLQTLASVLREYKTL